MISLLPVCANGAAFRLPALCGFVMGSCDASNDIGASAGGRLLYWTQAVEKNESLLSDGLVEGPLSVCSSGAVFAAHRYRFSVSFFAPAGDERSHTELHVLFV